jgi:hypothetical protein
MLSAKVTKSLAEEFFNSIVKPYFGGDWSKAVETLMLEATQDEEIFQKCRIRNTTH